MIIFNYASKKDLKEQIGKPYAILKPVCSGLNTRTMAC
jgi:hypothetical protein